MYKLTDCQYGVNFFFFYVFILIGMDNRWLRVEDCPKEVHQITSFTFYEILGPDILFSIYMFWETRFRKLDV